MLETFTISSPCYPVKRYKSICVNPASKDSNIYENISDYCSQMAPNSSSSSFVFPKQFKINQSYVYSTKNQQPEFMIGRIENYSMALFKNSIIHSSMKQKVNSNSRNKINHYATQTAYILPKSSYLPKLIKVDQLQVKGKGRMNDNPVVKRVKHNTKNILYSIIREKKAIPSISPTRDEPKPKKDAYKHRNVSVLTVRILSHLNKKKCVEIKRSNYVKQNEKVVIPLVQHRVKLSLLGKHYPKNIDKYHHIQIDKPCN
jgi:hypothetical protein